MGLEHLEGLYLQLSTLGTLAILSWVGFGLAFFTSMLAHRRWRRQIDECGALGDPQTCPHVRRVNVLAFALYRALTLAFLWCALAMSSLWLSPAMARQPIIEGTFAMATSTALLFEGGMVAAIFFVTVRLGDFFGYHRWQQPP